MVQRHVIVRKLSLLEALGAVTNIYLIRQAHWTQGKMIVKQAWVASMGNLFLEGGSEPFKFDSWEKSASRHWLQEYC